MTEEQVEGEISTIVPFDKLISFYVKLKRRKFQPEQANDIFEYIKNAKYRVSLDKYHQETVLTIIRIPYQILCYADIFRRFGSSNVGEFDEGAIIASLVKLAKDIDDVFSEKFHTEFDPGEAS